MTHTAGGDPADPPDPDASAHPFVEAAGPERAGLTDERGQRMHQDTRMRRIAPQP
jgi:hypothetical protein